MPEIGQIDLTERGLGSDDASKPMLEIGIFTGLQSSFRLNQICKGYGSDPTSLQQTKPGLRRVRSLSIQQLD